MAWYRNIWHILCRKKKQKKNVMTTPQKGLLSVMLKSASLPSYESQLVGGKPIGYLQSVVKFAPGIIEDKFIH